MSFLEAFDLKEEENPAAKGAVVIDVSNLIFRAIYGSQEFKRVSDVDLAMIRHMAWNIILRHRKMHDREQYPDLVLAFDGPRYWRKDIFPQYKKNRESKHEAGSKEQEVSDAVSTCFRQVRDELVENAPFPVIMVEGAEADDVMAWVPLIGAYERSVVVTGDKDMKQLIGWPNSIRVWSPGQGVDGGFVGLSKRDANDLLHEMICKGDSGDGIPNIYMADDAFYPVRVARQKPVSLKLVESLKALNGDIEKMSEDVRRGFERNRKLIDLSFTPVEVRRRIGSALHEQKQALAARRATLYKYFLAKGLSRHTANIQQFL